MAKARALCGLAPLVQLLRLSSHNSNNLAIICKLEPEDRKFQLCHLRIQAQRQVVRFFVVTSSNSERRSNSRRRRRRRLCSHWIAIGMLPGAAKLTHHTTDDDEQSVIWGTWQWDRMRPVCCIQLNNWMTDYKLVGGMVAFTCNSNLFYTLATGERVHLFARLQSIIFYWLRTTSHQLLMLLARKLPQKLPGIRFESRKRRGEISGKQDIQFQLLIVAVVVVVAPFTLFARVFVEFAKVGWPNETAHFFAPKHEF